MRLYGCGVDTSCSSRSTLPLAVCMRLKVRSLSMYVSRQLGSPGGMCASRYSARPSVGVPKLDIRTTRSPRLTSM